MSNQTRKEVVKDARKKRREYLLAKARIFAAGGSSLAVVLICGGITILGGLFTLLAGMGLRTGYFTHYDLFSMGLPVTILTGYLTYAGLRECRNASDKMGEIPYVLPVAEQLAALAALPAEDILVRASDEPAAAPEELLRAAQGGTMAPEEGLLRAETMEVK